MIKLIPHRFHPGHHPPKNKRDSFRFVAGHATF